MSMAEKLIEDFGEKIGGARKDLYALKRELRYGDIIDWNVLEREKFITKKEAFPLPNYEKMLKEGKDREVLFFIKKVRDALPTKPMAAVPYLASEEQKKTIIEAAQKNYLVTVNRFYEKAMELTSISECIKFYDEIKGENLPDENCFNRKLIRATDLGGSFGMYQFRKELENKQFLFSDEEKILSQFSFFRYDGQNVKKEEYEKGRECLVIKQGGSSTYLYNLKDASMTDVSTWQNDTFFVIKNNSREIVATNLPDRDAAEKEALKIGKDQNLSEKKKITNRKTRLIPPQLEHIRPTAKDYRSGANITGDDMINVFGFRAGEFGNWNSNNDRQTNLNMSYDAFKDLAKALNIEDADIALGGNLAIAYGARGRGSALAHFEPSANVINLTKMRGAGSLAHEWGHALDLYVAKCYNMDSLMATDASSQDNRQGKAPFKELMNTIQYNGNEKTEFYKNAEKLDKAFSKTDQGYWRSEVELFARAFASYVHDKLPENTSDYLVGHSEMVAQYVQDETTVQIPTSPQGKEREAINQAFDRALESLKEREILHNYVNEKEIEPKKEKERTNTAERITPRKRLYTQAESELMTQWMKEHLSVVDVCQSLGYSPIRVGQKYYSLKEHDSVRLDLGKNCFYWNSVGKNGSVIDACVAFGNMTISDAYNHLYDMAGGREAVFDAAVGNRELERLSIKQTQQNYPEQKRQENLKVDLPQRAAHMRNVYAYLSQTRQISADVINEFVKRKMLYQDVRNNCVFVSRNKEGEPVFACKRGSNTYKRFVADCRGNDYSKGFYVDNGAKKLFVGESVIDIMSKMTMLQREGKNYHDYNYLAMGGTEKQDPIENILKDTEIEEVALGLDNDTGGLAATEEIEHTLDRMKVAHVRDMPEIKGHDWNDALKDSIEQENMLPSKKELQTTDIGARAMEVNEADMAWGKQGQQNMLFERKSPSVPVKKPDLILGMER